ncbi:MAG: NADH-quinone oxidoreductase subunit D [candidate division Zixibacteria bacterium HGW-Zixibacteria-1]|nr:MAG: NADH-quinone oxidoreductase subunit D [candidate division Zixibacteria bacterium HGW-Zixibacteria-1]
MTVESKRTTMNLNMGPQHPATHGVLRVELELDGETVVKATPHIGYLHTGIEKTAESKLYYKAIPVTDRMDYLAPMSNNLGYCLAVEKLMEIEVPEKVVYARVLLTELTRVMSHLVWVGTHALDIGAMSMLLYAFRDRELIIDLYEACAGQRMMTTYFRIGGLAYDLPKDFDEKVKRILRKIPEGIQDYERLLNDNKIFRKRTIGVGVLSPEDAINCGVTGPILRGSGVNYDVRKATPYSGYEKFEFDIPLGKNGDTYDRYLVRMEEMKQSLRIAKQALDGMPEGPYRAHVPGVVLPPKEDVLSKMESLIYHFKIITEGFKPPIGSVYQAIESPKGELAFLISSDGSNKPHRMRVRPPSFVNLSALPKLVEGGLVADVIACIGSIDIVLGEVDR